MQGNNALKIEMFVKLIIQYHSLLIAVDFHIKLLYIHCFTLMNIFNWFAQTHWSVFFWQRKKFFKLSSNCFTSKYWNLKHFYKVGTTVVFHNSWIIIWLELTLIDGNSTNKQGLYIIIIFYTVSQSAVLSMISFQK